MLDREHRPALVVRQQAERAGIVGVGEDVDHGQPVGEGADRRPGVGAAGGHHQPVDALAQQLVEVLALAGRVVGGVAHEDGDALVGQPLLQRLDDRDGEAAEAVVRDDADGLRAGAAQAVGQVVRPVADLVGGAHDPVAGLLPHPAGPVQRLGGGADRDAGGARQVLDRGGAAWRPRPLPACRPCYFTAPLMKPAT